MAVGAMGRTSALGAPRAWQRAWRGVGGWAGIAPPLAGLARGAARSVHHRVRAIAPASLAGDFAGGRRARKARSARARRQAAPCRGGVVRAELAGASVSGWCARAQDEQAAARRQAARWQRVQAARGDRPHVRERWARRATQECLCSAGMWPARVDLPWACQCAARPSRRRSCAAAMEQARRREEQLEACSL